MNKAFRNIENIQKKVKDTLNDLLADNGYSLIMDEKFSDTQALILQWTNQEKIHAFQLRWDIREHWFDLGEFNKTNNLNFIESTEIDIFPYLVIGLFSRNSYDAKYVQKIKSKIEEKLSV